MTDEPENSGETDSDIDAETVAEEASEAPTEEGVGGAGDEPPMPPEDEGDVEPISIEEEDENLLPRLCDERNCLTRFARCARRVETGASAHFVLDE